MNITNLSKKIIALGLFVLLTLSCSKEESSVDSNLHTKRIISLSPHITEILYALQVEDQIIAVTDFCTYPPQAAKKPSIGGLLNPNLERLIALQPDMLIGSLSHTDLAAKLQDKPYNFVLLPDRTVNDIYAIIDSLGRLLHIQQNADSLLKTMQDTLNYYRQQSLTLGKASPRAVFLFGGGSRNLSIIGPGSFTDDLWRYLGGENVFSGLQSSFAQINREALFKANPDIIIEFKPELPDTGVLVTGSRKEWSKFKHIQAVQTNHIYQIRGQSVLIPGPRITRLAGRFMSIIKKYQEYHQ